MPVADMRQHHDSRALIDPVGKVLRRDEPRLVFRHVLDDSPATLLRVPDLPAGREFVVAYENPVATAGKIERRRKRVDTGRGRCRDRDFFPSGIRSEEHTSELQSLMRISYAVFCLKNKK